MHRAKQSIVHCTAAVIMLSITVNAWEAGKQPNIIMIFADDLGWGDISCNNPAAAYTTPNLDKMANEGIRFTAAHSASTICSPSRYSLQSGKQVYRTGRGTTAFEGCGGPSYLTATELTLGKMLQSKGYRTGVFGKWHIGLTWYDSNGKRPSGVQLIDYERSTPLVDGPLRRGYNESFITPNCPCTDPLYLFIANDTVPLKATVAYSFNRSKLTDGTYVGKWSYDNDAGLMPAGFDMEQVDRIFLEKSQDFIHRHRKNYPDKPFFVSLNTQIAHAPVFPHPSALRKTKAGPRGDFVWYLDWMVGELMKTLDTLKLDTSTLVMFSSDNGAEVQHYAWMRSEFNHDPSGGWRGVKRECWEGGHRVPFIAWWPGVIPSKQVTAQLFNITDIFATTASIIGFTLPDSAATDSWDMFPVFLKLVPDTHSVRTYVLTQSFYNGFQIQKGNWKFIESAGSCAPHGNDYATGVLKPYYWPDTANAPAQLYDLKNDPRELANQYNVAVSVRQELQALLAQAKSSGRSAPKGRTPFKVPCGCTDPAYKEYDSTAVYNDRTKCLTLIGSKVDPVAIRTKKAGYRLQGDELFINAPGYHQVLVFSAAGRMLLSCSNKNSSSYHLNKLLSNRGLYVIKVQTGLGNMVQKIALY